MVEIDTTTCIDGLDPEEEPLFREFESFIAAIAKSITSNTLEALKKAVDQSEKSLEVTLKNLNEELINASNVISTSKDITIAVLDEYKQDFTSQITHSNTFFASKAGDTIDNIVKATNDVQNQIMQLSDIINQSRNNYINLFIPVLEKQSDAIRKNLETTFISITEDLRSQESTLEQLQQSLTDFKYDLKHSEKDRQQLESSLKDIIKQNHSYLKKVITPIVIAAFLMSMVYPVQIIIHLIYH